MEGGRGGGERGREMKRWRGRENIWARDKGDRGREGKSEKKKGFFLGGVGLAAAP
jgi:hypothetical protein